MILTNEVLKRTCRKEVVGDFHPYNTGDWNKTEDYIRVIVDKIKEIPTLMIHADFDHFGSGTASFVEVYAIKNDGSLTTNVQESKEGHQIETVTTIGLLLAISRVAPVAVMGSDERQENKKDGITYSGYYSKIQSHKVDSLPPGNWIGELSRIKEILNDFKIELLDYQKINQHLEFNATIRTFLNNQQPYKVFDALFYWQD